ncbi:hypothetical protein [Glycomyces terrestris]|uniref:Uncharacterized protein n=1 Tax=Glycomyces terrestris TaxID=2493553 RepID=A0A426UVM8_9ACTN|nr:hypothetical protein [Glycomyces terrestris]RRR98380.1 hypothetical protein EIW28_15895 [Glycomyces terrestris]
MSQTPPQPTGKTRPGSVSFAVWLQILLAVFFVAQTIIGFIYGPDAQAAAEAELEAQGFSTADLPEGTTFESGGATAFVPIAFAVLLIVLAVLNAAGNRVGRILTWIVQPLVLICGGLIAFTLFFAAASLEAGLEATGEGEGLDVQALFDAVYGAYPSWTAVVDYGLVALATLGSLLVIVLLAVPSANAYFRKEEPEKFIPGAPPA